MKSAPVLGITLMTPPSQDRKRARKPKGSKTTLGEKSVPERYQQHSELSSTNLAPKPLSPVKEYRERVKNHARNAKVRATQDWIDGNMKTEDHERVHRRANHVLAGKGTAEFRGRTGEKASARKLPW